MMKAEESIKIASAEPEPSASQSVIILKSAKIQKFIHSSGKNVIFYLMILLFFHLAQEQQNCYNQRGYGISQHPPYVRKNT